jgi:DNA-binding NtrC family response regulator
MKLDSHTQLILAQTAPDVEKTMFFFEWLQKNYIQTPVLAILPEAPADGVLGTVAQVVDDFLLCPLREDELKLRVAKFLVPHSNVCDELLLTLGKEMALARIAGKHPSFQKALEQARLFGASNAAVLITGETGTGKELFAHAIHSLSSARDGGFIPVDCGAIPDHLAENELFGHRRGAFTDANSDQKGLAAMADGGTLFLDEIDSLSLANQAKLLRFLQEGSYRALGSDRFTKVNVRIIAATNRCLEEAVREKEFRSDLYFRLSVLRMNLPSLRERYGDVPLLARHFLESESQGPGKSLSSAAMRKLENHSWPGNVRELFNVIQRAVVCSSGRQIMPEHIVLADEAPGQVGALSLHQNLKAAKRQMIEEFERGYIEELLARHQGNVTRAAREAGKERRAFGRLVKKYSIAGHSCGIGMGH